MANSVDLSQVFSPLLDCLNSIKLQLTCPKCSDLLSMPISLPCGHTFCSQCMKPKGNYQYDCHACPSTYSIKDLSYVDNTHVFVNYIKVLDDVVANIFQTLGLQVDKSEHGIIKGKAPKFEVALPGPKYTVGKSQGCLVAASGLKLASKDIPLWECIGSDKKLQGGTMPQEEAPVSSTDSNEEPRGKSVSIVYTCRPRDGRQSTKLADFRSKKCIENEGNGFISKRLAMNVIQNKGEVAETKGNKDHSTCKRRHPNHATGYGTYSRLVPYNVRNEKRHRLNLPHKSNADNQFTNTRKLPYMETVEKTMAKTSLSPIEPSALLGNATLKRQLPEVWLAAFDTSTRWRLCGTDLSESQEKLLDGFANWIGASLTTVWKKDTTHVIISTDEQGICQSTKKVLMAILNGQWVVNFDWIKACIETHQPVAEEPYEVRQISLQGCVGAGSNGPMKGRLRVMKKAPKIFSGVSFYFGDQFVDFDRPYLQELVSAAGGIVLKTNDLKSKVSLRKVLSSGPSYIVYSENTPNMGRLQELWEIGSTRRAQAMSLSAKTGLKVIGHFQLLDAIATCSSSEELMKLAIK